MKDGDKLVAEWRKIVGGYAAELWLQNGLGLMPYCRHIIEWEVWLGLRLN